MISLAHHSEMRSMPAHVPIITGGNDSSNQGNHDNGSSNVQQVQQQQQSQYNDGRNNNISTRQHQDICNGYFQFKWGFQQHTSNR